MFFIYLLKDPRNMQPFYVGYSGDKTRPEQHIKKARKTKINNHRLNKIRKIEKEGYYVLIEIVYYTEDKNDAINKEIELIEKYGRYDLGKGILTNMTNGGEGSKLYKHTKKHRNRLKKNNPGAKATSYPVVQYDDKGYKIAEYTSYNKAAKATDSNKNSIRLSTTENWRMHNGYFWRNKKDAPDFIENAYELKQIHKKFTSKKRNIRKIYQYDIFNNFLYEYESIQEASDKIGVKQCTLWKAARENRIYANHRWVIA